jgi:excisionase family DNA binding protein
MVDYTIMNSKGVINMTGDEMYTLKEISELLKIPESTLRNYIRQGKLQSLKFGRHHRVTKSHLEAFVSEATKQPNN